MLQSQWNEHLQEHAAYHNILLLEMALNLSRDVESLMCRNPRLLSRNPGFASHYEKTMSDILSQVQNTVKENRELRGQVEALERRIIALEREMARLEAAAQRPLQPARGQPARYSVPTSVEAMDPSPEQQVEWLAQQLEAAHQTIRGLQRREEAAERALTIRYIALANLEERVRQQQASSYDGVLLWKIDNFSERKNDAISRRQPSFYSPCFYTSHYGYKMCARIYLNGDGMGRGTHISVSFVVMRGQYDALLRWPFRQKVTIMLLDQDNVEHVIDAFRPDPNSASFQRPRREMNIARGLPLFCSLAELNKHAYVRDDVMFMKIIVDTSDL